MPPRRISRWATASVLVCLAIACSTTAPAPDQACAEAGGACVPTTDTVGCAMLLSPTCSTGLTCCMLVEASTGVDAGTDTGPEATTPVPDATTTQDTGVPDATFVDALHEATASRDGLAEAAHDAHIDAVHDAEPSEAAAREAAADAATDVVSDAHADVSLDAAPDAARD